MSNSSLCPEHLPGWCARWGSRQLTRLPTSYPALRFWLSTPTAYPGARALTRLRCQPRCSFAELLPYAYPATSIGLQMQDPLIYAADNQPNQNAWTMHKSLPGLPIQHLTACPQCPFSWGFPSVGPRLLLPAQPEGPWAQLCGSKHLGR